MAVRLGIDLSDFQKEMKEFQKTWGGLGRQLQDAGTKIGVAFTAAGGAIAAGLGFAVNKAMDFDAQMSRVSAIAGATGAELEALRQTALDLGASTSKSAGEVAVGMELMAQKGYDAQQVIAAMPGVIAAAEASGEDMALVADTVASALNAFQMEASDASKVADILAKSANTSAAGVQDLQYAFKYAAPVANALGISLEELAAATGIMADNGMKGEQAGTTLRAALLRLTDPPKEAAAELKKLGVSVTDASGKFLPFDQIIGQLAASTANMTNAQEAQALST
ncbi:phage tail tape measure protein, partial [Myxococcus sp. CA039A]|nr:phage tail tape measure protein [Myxococcus sp. CA039A]